MSEILASLKKKIGGSGGYVCDLLWTNPNSTTLSAGDVSLPSLSNYTGVIITQHQVSGCQAFASIYVPIGEVQYLMQSRLDVYGIYRKAEVKSDRVTFSTGYGGSQYGMFTSDAWVVPDKIYGTNIVL